MTQYNTLNVKFSNLQLNKLKSRIKNGTEVISQVSKLCKAFENVSSANKKLSKVQLHKIGQSGGF